ncbi:8610_t:CDS:1 [Ambispora gerdemannii]|uniref:8610_t:CDS:1 n=1 Tax=Ambispora gerdemannii TaxID=144530 RepID=A0A9N8V162_9GLOM|nr:8610_t:CDS:1 [Ambispora gerdemannii]
MSQPVQPAKNAKTTTGKGVSQQNATRKPPNDISDTQKKELIDYFFGASDYKYELLKYIYICITATRNGYEQVGIEKECAELRQIINESKIGFEPGAKETAISIIDEYSEWRRSDKKKPENLLRRIELILKIQESILENLFKLKIYELSAFRTITFQKFKGMIDFNNGGYSELWHRSKKDEKIAELEAKCKNLEEKCQTHEDSLKQLEEIKTPRDNTSNSKQKKSVKDLQTQENTCIRYDKNNVNSNANLQEETSLTREFEFMNQINLLTATNDSLKQECDTMRKQIQEKEREVNNLRNQIEQTSKHKNSSDNFSSENQATYENYEKNDNTTTVEAHENKLSMEDLNKLSKEELIDDIKEYQVKYDSFRQQFDTILQEVQEKDEEINRLRKQIKQYQSALGNVTNVQLGENDANNSFQLVKDIERIQADVSDAVKIKGKKIEIMPNQANDLLYKSYSRTKISDDNGKMALSCALQRFIVWRIFRDIENIAKNYKFDNMHKDEYTEQFIVVYIQDLCMLTEKLSTHRIGEDDFTRVTPIKIRQQVYAALGARGFQRQEQHPTIKHYSNCIINQLNQCRKLPQEMNEEMQTRVDELVLDLMQLRFRIDTQEPVPEIRWFKAGEPIHVGLMQGAEVEDNEELEVDLCYFPVIGTFLDDPQNRKVYFKAQVLTRIKQHDQRDQHEQRGALKNVWNNFTKNFIRK